MLLVPILSIYLKTEKQGFLKWGKINIKSCAGAALWHSGLNCQWQHAIPAPVHVVATSLRIQLPANAAGRAADVPSTWVSAFQVGYGMKLSALTWHSPAPAAIRGSKPEDGRNLSCVPLFLHNCFKKKCFKRKTKALCCFQHLPKKQLFCP